ncbi:MAG: hypothetical protein ABI472_04230 [Ginsengibacter sp.]
MGWNDIKLNGFLYHSLFGNKLVDLKSQRAGEVVNGASQIEFLGGNEKKITFLANDSQNKFLSDLQLNFLHDLLSACELTMADIAFVNFLQENTITYRELITQLHSKKILVFGVTGSEIDLPFAIPFFQIQHFQEQQYMMAPALEDIQKKTELKKQLWKSLQKIFDIHK